MRFFRFSKGFFLAEIREVEVVFWSIMFPLLLYAFLTAVLGNHGNNGGMSFNLGVVGRSASPLGTMAIDRTLKAITGEDGPFRATAFEDPERALDSLKRGEQDVLVFLNGEGGLPIPVALHAISGRESSQVAANILETAFGKANLEIARRGGKGFVSITSETVPVVGPGSRRGVDYKDYIFPSVALMMMMLVSLFNCPLSLSYYRTYGVNKKLFTTPLSSLEYFGAHLAKLVLTMLISISLLYAMAWFLYRVRSDIFSPAFVLGLLLAMFTMVSFGLMIASFARKESTAGILGQVLNQVMMFLGGFYFPVFGLPWSIRWVVYLLPTTYLVELLRRGMGLRTAPLSQFWLIAVPMAWMLFSVIVFTLNFRKVMGRE